MSLIVDIIGEVVELRSVDQGRKYLGLCPFHNTTEPSFYVAPDENYFHCFGCGAHGDAVGFVMRHRDLTFVDAVNAIAAAWI